MLSDHALLHRQHWDLTKLWKGQESYLVTNDEPPLEQVQLGCGSGLVRKMAGAGLMSRGSEVLRSSVPPESVLKQGWMEKRGDGQFGAEWRTRYFSLTGSHLIYFEKPDSECALGCIYLHKARAKLSKDSGAGQTLRFELQVTSCASERMYYLACATMDDQQSWLAAIKDAVANCPAQVYSNALSCV